jgi:WD40 repeat protein
MRILSGSHSAAIQSLAYSPNCRLLASGGDDRAVILWDLMSPHSPYKLGFHDRGGVIDLAFSPDGKTLASLGSDGTVRLWNMNSLKCQASTSSIAPQVYAISFAQNEDEIPGRLRVVGNRRNQLHLTEVIGAKVSPTWLRSTTELHSAQFSNDGRLIAVAQDGYVRFYRSEDGRFWGIVKPKSEATPQWWYPINHWMQRHSALHCSLLDEKHLALFIGIERRIHCWKADLVEWVDPDEVWEEANPLGYCAEDTTLLHGHRAPITTLALHPDKKRLISGSFDRTIRIWDWEEKRSLEQYQWHRGKVNKIVISPDGTTAASGGSDQTIVVWDL